MKNNKLVAGMTFDQASELELLVDETAAVMLTLSGNEQWECLRKDDVSAVMYLVHRQLVRIKELVNNLEVYPHESR